MLIDAQQNEKGLDGSIKALHQTSRVGIPFGFPPTKQFLRSRHAPLGW